MQNLHLLSLEKLFLEILKLFQNPINYMVSRFCRFYSLVHKQTFILGMPTDSVQHGVEPVWPWVLAKNEDASLMKKMSCSIELGAYGSKWQ